jgi:hypothetical protein
MLYIMEIIQKQFKLLRRWYEENIILSQFEHQFELYVPT